MSLDPKNPTGGIAPGTPAPAPAPAPGGATPDIAALIQQGVAAAMKPLNDQITALHAKIGTRDAAGGGVRDRFLSEKMSDVPEIYRQKMPDTADTNELLKQEQNIRQIYQADLKSRGFAKPDIGGRMGGGTSPIDSANYSGMTPAQLVSEGIKQSGIKRNGG